MTPAMKATAGAFCAWPAAVTTAALVVDVDVVGCTTVTGGGATVCETVRLR